MTMICPWCKSGIAHNALVCPHCTRSLADWHQHMLDSVSPKRAPAHTLPCHGCGAFVPDDLFGDSRAGDRPGRCPACSCSLDTAYWDRRAERPVACDCDRGLCRVCHGHKNLSVGLLWWKKLVPCGDCGGTGKCNWCKGTSIVQF